MSNRLGRSIGIAVIIVLMFAAIILFTLFMKKDGAKLIDKFQSTDCSKTGIGYSRRDWVEGAVAEFKQKKDDPEGVLSCFCNLAYDKYGDELKKKKYEG